MLSVFGYTNPFDAWYDWSQLVFFSKFTMFHRVQTRATPNGQNVFVPWLPVHDSSLCIKLKNFRYWCLLERPVCTCLPAEELCAFFMENIFKISKVSSALGQKTLTRFELSKLLAQCSNVGKEVRFGRNKRYFVSDHIVGDRDMIHTNPWWIVQHEGCLHVAQSLRPIRQYTCIFYLQFCSYVVSVQQNHGVWVGAWPANFCQNIRGCNVVNNEWGALKCVDGDKSPIFVWWHKL